MKTLWRITDLLGGVNELVGRAVAWLALALCAVTAWDVFARYIFHSGSVALQELEWHIFSALFLLAAGYTLKKDEHVRVDVVYARLGVRGKAVMNLAGSLFLLMPFCALVVYVSAGFVASSWELGEGSPDPGGLPARYVLKAAIPAGFSLLLLQGAAEALRSFLLILGPREKGAEE
ncbi:MAG: TRAP transporter small permease subunit [Candidatus Nitrospinota bacterium M3_3B_026]